MKKLFATALLTSASILVSPMAAAQAQTTSPAAIQSEESKASQVGDIVVTAQRRSENLQDVPVAVTALSGKQLEATGIDTVLDLKISAPSLNTAAASGIFGSSIRGIGSFGFSPGIESEIALYIDGAYIATPLASELALANVASVEVLKGPQGTLFGRNSTGGLIQVTTATPKQSPEGRFSLEYGSYNDVVGAAYVTGGIAENLAMDLSVRAERRDGFGKNLTTGSEANGIHHDFVARSKLFWEPGDNTTVTAVGNYWDGRNHLGTGVVLPGTFNAWTGQQAPDYGKNDYSANIDEALNGWTAGGSLKIEHDMGGVRLMSLSAFRKVNFEITRDLDYSPQSVASLALLQTDKHFSQELQLSSIGNSPFKWVAGVFYFNLKSAYPAILVDLSGSVNAAAIAINATQRAKSWAGYAQGTYELAEGTNLTLGGRYTTERRSEVNSSQEIRIVNGPVIPIAYPDRSVTANKFTYRASLDHRLSEALMVYTSTTTGFKSGGYNTNAPGDPSFKPEELTAYEIGAKADVLDRRLRLNIAGFHYDYKNIQVQRVGTFALQTVNGASSRIYGIDADVTAVLSNEFTLSGGAAWLNTKFKSFPGCPISTRDGTVPVAIGSCAGNALPFAAKFSGSLMALYTKRASRGEFQGSASIYYNSGYAAAADNVFRSDRYARIGATVKWTSDNNYSVSLVGRNLTNIRPLQYVGSQTNGTNTGSYLEPRTVSIVVGFNF
ncbi:MAG: TonB-dependent receptor [Sphingobium sp.]|uniref:TonB-dependent receptor n=1 Tax=Sphingobium sp. TaxID=1912891 RepID=UPI0029BEFD00|nr:TonB-dependent receptor [Sphingobium sp.]MDX3910851.1 TonB-dependent receptor [Sphingobium sp.]